MTQMKRIISGNATLVAIVAAAGLLTTVLLRSQTRANATTPAPAVNKEIAEPDCTLVVTLANGAANSGYMYSDDAYSHLTFQVIGSA